MIDETDQQDPGVQPLGGTTASGLPYPSDTDPVQLGAANIKALADAIDRRFKIVAVSVDVPSTAAHTSMAPVTVAIPGLAVGDYCFWVGVGTAGPYHYWTAPPLCAVAGQITLRGFNADSAVNDPTATNHYFMVIAHA